MDTRASRTGLCGPDHPRGRHPCRQPTTGFPHGNYKTDPNNVILSTVRRTGTRPDDVPADMHWLVDELETDAFEHAHSTVQGRVRTSRPGQLRRMMVRHRAPRSARPHPRLEPRRTRRAPGRSSRALQHPPAQTGPSANAHPTTAWSSSLGPVSRSDDTPAAPDSSASTATQPEPPQRRPTPPQTRQLQRAHFPVAHRNELRREPSADPFTRFRHPQPQRRG